MWLRVCAVVPASCQDAGHIKQSHESVAVTCSERRVHTCGNRDAHGVRAGKVVVVVAMLVLTRQAVPLEFASVPVNTREILLHLHGFLKRFLT